jgi:hypothetical protein
MSTGFDSEVEITIRSTADGSIVVSGATIGAAGFTIAVWESF